MTELNVRAAGSCHCPTGRRRTVTDSVLFRCLRSSSALPPPRGEWVVGPPSARIQVSIELAGERITALRYRASSCATLIAYAEVLGELVEGRPQQEAARVDPDRRASPRPGPSP